MGFIPPLLSGLSTAAQSLAGPTVGGLTSAAANVGSGIASASTTAASAAGSAGVTAANVAQIGSLVSTGAALLLRPSLGKTPRPPAPPDISAQMANAQATQSAKAAALGGTVSQGTSGPVSSTGGKTLLGQ